MKFSILNEDCVNDDKGGFPVHIDGTYDADSLEEFAYICQHHHIAISVFKDEYRSGKNWISSDFLSVDFDDGKTTSQEVHDFLTLNNLNHIIIASKNHLKDKNDGKGIIERFHVFIPFSESLIVGDEEMYKFISNEFNRRFKRKGWKIDEGTSTDKCRYYFKHREMLFLHETGLNINISLMKSNKIGFDNLQNRLKEKRKKENVKFEKRLTKKWDNEYRPTLSCSGQRHNGVVKAAGYLKTLGFDEGESFDLITAELGSYGSDVGKAIRWVYSK